MSTILKALQRLEEDKAPKPEMSLDDQVISGGGGPTPPRKRGWLGIAAGLAAGVAAAFALIALWPGADEHAAPAPAPAPEEVAQAPVPQPAYPAPAARAAARPPSEAAADEALPIARAPIPAAMRAEVSQEVEVVERVARPSPLDAAADAEEETPPRDPRSVQRAPRTSQAERRAQRLAAAAARPTLPSRRRPAAKPEAEVGTGAAAAAQKRPEAVQPAPKPAPRAEAEPAPRAEKAPAPKPAPRPAAAPAKPPPTTVAAARSAPSDAPSDAPKSGSATVVRRAELPDLRVRRTVWHPDPAKRLAVVELLDEEETLELREGDAVGPLVIGTIKPSGVEFVHDGVTIQQSISND